MTNKSYRALVMLRNPVDPATLQLLRVLDPIAEQMKCPYFIAGATARDLILVNLHGLQPGRATYDVDFGVAVQNWNDFADLKEQLIATGTFSPTKAPHRLLYKDSNGNTSIPVDLIPFGGIESENGVIAWPPGNDVLLNVAGFDEAFVSSIQLEFEPGLIIPVASTPGLTLLKLTAWMDRGRNTNKDAVDIYQLLLRYGDAGNIDRLFDQELELLELASFDIVLAGAELLGRDVAAICSPQYLPAIKTFLTLEHELDRLVAGMVRSGNPEDDPLLQRIVTAFSRGIQTP